MKEKNKTYTVADFSRYHSGTMPASEMHELEKAALEDPFLEDALEGYTHATDFASDIKELNQRLTEKRKKKNIFFLSPFAENKWWRIAAIFIVIAGAAYLFVQVNNGSKNNSLAKNEVKVPAKEKDSASGIKPRNEALNNDSSVVNQQVFTAERGEKNPLSSAKPLIKKVYIDSTAEHKSKAFVPLRKLNAAPYADSAYVGNPSRNNEELSSKDFVLQGKVTDNKVEPVPFASVKDKTSNKITITDTAGQFLAGSPDSSIKARASAIEFASKNFSLKKDTPPTAAINKTGEDLNEVVVVGYGTKKKAARLSNVLNGKTPSVQVTSGPQPAGGQEKFNRYLKDNMTPVYDSNGVQLKGEVSLSFIINKKGKPKNIKVTKSSCPACEREAVKLLENGPKWRGKKNEQGAAVIKF